MLSDDQTNFMHNAKSHKRHHAFRLIHLQMQQGRSRCEVAQVPPYHVPDMRARCKLSITAFGESWRRLLEAAPAGTVVWALALMSSPRSQA
jgi:hypothetical protein